MTSLYRPWLISALWFSLTLLAFVVADATSIRNWVLVMTMGVVPGVVLLKLWSEEPPATVAEVLFATEARR